jgi:hypothetical protein
VGTWCGNFNVQFFTFSNEFLKHITHIHYIVHYIKSASIILVYFGNIANSNVYPLQQVSVHDESDLWKPSALQNRIEKRRVIVHIITRMDVIISRGLTDRNYN